jgi:hypothetical protein
MGQVYAGELRAFAFALDHRIALLNSQTPGTSTFHYAFITKNQLLISFAPQVLLCVKDEDSSIS